MDAFTITIDQSLSLKTLTIQDAPVVFSQIDTNREHLGKWFFWVPLTKTEKDSAAYITNSLDNLAAGKSFDLAIWYDGAIVGMIGVHEINKTNRHTSIGYWLAESYQSKGIMTRSVKALVDYLFTEMGLHRVEIRCAVENTRSANIARRLSFTHEGTIREAEFVNNTFLDHQVYGMLEHEWQKLAN